MLCLRRQRQLGPAMDRSMVEPGPDEPPPRRRLLPRQQRFALTARGTRLDPRPTRPFGRWSALLRRPIALDETRRDGEVVLGHRAHARAPRAAPDPALAAAMALPARLAACCFDPDFEAGSRSCPNRCSAQSPTAWRRSGTNSPSGWLAGAARKMSRSIGRRICTVGSIEQRRNVRIRRE